MSYNILSGSVNFEGAGQGSIEDIVDKHSVQTITGQKTFSNLSSSADVSVVGNLSASINISASAFYANGVLVNPAGGGAVSAVANGADNRIATFSSADALNGEQKLTFNGTVLDFTDTSISGSGNISGSQFYGSWAGSNILGSQIQKASAGGIGDSGGLTLTTTGLASQATPAGTVSLFIDESGTIKKSTIAQILTNQSITDASALGNSGRILLDGGVGTISSNGDLSLTTSPTRLTVNGEISASSNVNVGGILRADNHISASQMTLASQIRHEGDEDTYISFANNSLSFVVANGMQLNLNGNLDTTSVANSDFAVSTSGLPFQVNNSNGFVGIGDTSPSVPLEISSSNDPQFKIVYNGSNAATFKVASNGNLTIGTNGATTVDSNLTINGNAVLGDNSADTTTINGTAVSIPNGLNFDSNTLFISASNNRVGIGTISPAAPLEIFNAGTQLKLSYDASDSATIAVDDNGFLTLTPSGEKTIIKHDLIVQDDVSTDTIVQIFDSSDDGVIAGYANNVITTKIHANGTTFFNGGNVAIGGEVAEESLSVSGSFQVSGSHVRARLANSIFEISSSTTIQSGGQALFEVKSPTNPNLFGIAEGGVIASNIQPAAFNANLYVSGAVVLGAPTAVVPDANLHNGSVSFFLDEGNNKLKFRIRYSNGTLKNGEINLT